MLWRVLGRYSQVCLMFGRTGSFTFETESWFLNCEARCGVEISILGMRECPCCSDIFLPAVDLMLSTGKLTKLEITLPLSAGDWTFWQTTHWSFFALKRQVNSSTKSLTQFSTYFSHCSVEVDFEIHSLGWLILIENCEWQVSDQKSQSLYRCEQ